jgi:hypothetical protein
MCKAMDSDSENWNALSTMFLPPLSVIYAYLVLYYALAAAE